MVGNRQLMQEEGVELPRGAVEYLRLQENEAATCVLLAAQCRLLAILAIKDQLKPEAQGVVAALAAMGLQVGAGVPVCVCLCTYVYMGGDACARAWGWLGWLVGGWWCMSTCEGDACARAWGWLGGGWWVVGGLLVLSGARSM